MLEQCRICGFLRGLFCPPQKGKTVARLVRKRQSESDRGRASAFLNIRRVSPGISGTSEGCSRPPGLMSAGT